MEHGRDPDPRAQMLGVGGDLDHGVGARAHQQIVDLAFVLVGDIGNGLWQSEDEVEVPHRQQFSFARGQPRLCRTGLTFWAVPVPAGIVGDVFVRAVLTAGYMAAERRGAAALDRAHHLHLIKANMACIGRPPRRTMVTEDIRDL